MKTIETRGLSAGSLYKLLFIGLVIPLFFFSLCCGIASLFGYDTVSFNNQYVHGIQGLVVGLVLGIILPAIMSAFLWVPMIIGIWLWTRVKTLTLNLKE